MNYVCLEYSCVGLHLDLLEYVTNYKWECTDCKKCMKCNVSLYYL